MNCKKCGSEINNTSAYCDKCGKKVKNESISNKNKLDIACIKDKFKTLSKEKKKKIIIIFGIIVVLSAGGIVGINIHKNTPRHKAMKVSNTFMKSLKMHDGKDFGLTDAELITKLADSPYVGLSIFNYKFKSISESDNYETFSYKIGDSDTELDYDIALKKLEVKYLEEDTAGKWIENKSYQQVTFTSQKYKLKKYYITYDVKYSESDGIAKESDVTLIVQKKNHSEKDYTVMDIVGI